MNTIKTSDLQFAAFAICKGAAISRIDRSSLRAVFILTSRTEKSELRQEFWGNPMVKVNDFTEAQRELKRRLFSDCF